MVAKNLATKIDPGFAMHKMPEPGIGVPLERAAGGSVDAPQTGINVRSDSKAGVRYADEIVDGNKAYETRDTDSLRPYVGKRVAIVRTGDGPAKAIGEATIGEPIVADQDMFHRLRDRHLVPKGSAFDIKPGSTKHLYPIHNPVRYKNEFDVGAGIVARKVLKRAAGGAIKPVMGRKREQNLAEFMRDAHPIAFDDKGKPRRFYHGTARSGIYKFEGHRGSAGHFAFHPEVASDFAKTAHEDEQDILASGEEDYGDGGQIYAVHLNVKNPFDIENPDHREMLNMPLGFWENQHHDYELLEDLSTRIRNTGFDSYIDYEHPGEKTGIAVFEPHQIKSAVGNIGTFDPEDPDITKAEGGATTGGYEPGPLPALSVDNPGGEWLQEKQDYSQSRGYMPSGAPKSFGTVTATWRDFVHLPVSMLKEFRGVMNEQENVRQHSLDWLLDKMSTTGRLPKFSEDSKNEYHPFITVDQRGIPFVSEGNHRIMAADKLGWKWLPVEIRYFNGGEDADGPLHPEKIRALHGAPAKKAFGGEVEGQTAYPEEGAARMQQQLPMMRNLQPLGITREAGDQSQFIGTPAVVSQFNSPDNRPHYEYDYLHYTPPISKWVNNTFAKYIRRDMGSDSDPLRKLADEEGLLYAPRYEHLAWQAANRNRKLPEDRKTLAKTEAGSMWEDFADHLLSVMGKRQAQKEFPEEKWLKDAPESGKFIAQKDFYDKGSLHYFKNLFTTLDAAVHPDNPWDLPDQFRLRPESFDRLPVTQAVRRANEIWKWRKDQEGKPNPKTAFNNPAVKLVYEYPHSDLAWYEIGPSGTVQYENPDKPDIREASDPFLQKALKYEGDQMGHCVGGYGSSILSPHIGSGATQSRVYSLRNKKTGEPHVTIDGQSYYDDRNKEFHPDGRWKSKAMVLNQIRGKQDDQPASKYLPYVRDFITEERAGNPIKQISEMEYAGLESANAKHDFIKGRKKNWVHADRDASYGDIDEYYDVDEEERQYEDEKENATANLRQKDSDEQARFDKAFLDAASPEERERLIESQKVGETTPEHIAEVLKKYEEDGQGWSTPDHKHDHMPKFLQDLAGAAWMYTPDVGTHRPLTEREKQSAETAKVLYQELINHSANQFGDRDFSAFAPFFTPSMLKAAAFKELEDRIDVAKGVPGLHEELMTQLNMLRDAEKEKIPAELARMAEFVDPMHVEFAKAANDHMEALYDGKDPEATKEKLLDRLQNGLGERLIRNWSEYRNMLGKMTQETRFQKGNFDNTLTESRFMYPQSVVTKLTNFLYNNQSLKNLKKRPIADEIAYSFNEWPSKLEIERRRRASGGKATALPLAKVRVPNSDTKAIRKALMIAKSRRQ